MSVRMGVTTAEEKKIARMVAAGASWGDIVGELTDVDLDYVKENFYKPAKAAADAKALADDIGKADK